jgi:hypothetical protein
VQAAKAATTALFEQQQAAAQLVSPAGVAMSPAGLKAAVDEAVRQAMLR